MKRGHPDGVGYTRRRALAGIAGAASLSGCFGSDAGTGEETLAFDHPEEVPGDEPFELTIEGLPRETTVDVVLDGGSPGPTARTTVRTGDGTVDLADPEIVDGDVPATLDVPTTVGLIQFSDQSLWSYDPPTEETVTYRVERDGRELGATSVTRTHVDWLEFPAIDHDELVGRLVTPPDGDPAPGVLVLHGSAGEPDVDVAAKLAANGFAALALRYFGIGELRDDLVEIPLEYVETAIEWLLDHERTTGGTVGIHGMSRGGELALLAGSQLDGVGAVVSIAGSGVVAPGLDGDGPAETSAWSLDGEPVPYLDAPVEGATREEIEPATIPVENVDGPVLLVSGTDDEVWNALERQRVAESRLDERGHPEFEHLVYEGAGHMIRPPYVPVGGSGRGGGSNEANAYASHDYWPTVLETLAAVR